MKPNHHILFLSSLKRSTHHGDASASPDRFTSGMALLLVLSFLVLISALVVAFFSTVSTELAGAKNYASEVSVKQLADSTSQLAIAAVREATAGVDPSSANSPLAWASQPGMIRTYDNTGSPHSYYKLYSSDNMVVTSFPFDPAQDFDTQWNTKPALYTDLNAPVASGTDLSYPVIDPAAENQVKGFKITSPSSFDGSNAASPTNNKAPMPTKWIYVLQDGRLTSPTGVDATGKIADWTGAAIQPTASNPVVGRIAFWTDDDTCKININTAAGDVWGGDTSPAPGNPGNPGSFWDIPRTYSPFERTYMAQNQPAQKEFQRYPGHPATTYLSAVFPNLTTADIYAISPRVAPGGSQSGMTVAASTITPDTDRLYASSDELLYAVSGTASATRAANPSLSSTNVKLTKFFLTAHSRAPEINLFNQPRVVIWPVSSGTTAQDRTPYDNLIAYCGTLAGHPFYFQRSDCNSPVTDLPPIATSTGLGRNRALIGYLRNLTRQPIPGFGGGTFLDKYPNDRDQILTEIFDYIRGLNAQDMSISGLNPFTLTSGTKAKATGTAGQGQIVPITDDIHSDSNTDTLRGFGRFPTVREASLLFVGVGQTSGTNKSIPPNSSQGPSVSIADGKTRVQAAFSLNFFDPSQGFGSCIPNYQVRVKNLDGFLWSGTGMGFNNQYTLPIKANFGGDYGGFKGASSFVCSYSTSTPADEEPHPVLSSYIDLATNSAAAPTSFNFSGGDVTIEILSPSSQVLQTITVNFPSTSFPVPFLAPLLTDPGSGVYSGGVIAVPMNIDFRNLTKWTKSTPAARVGRFTGMFQAGIDYSNTQTSTSSRTWICGKDVVRSVEVNTDLRLVAALKTVPSSYFKAVPDYYDTTKLQSHSIFECLNGGGLYTVVGGAKGKLVSGADYLVASPTDYIYSSPSTSATDALQPLAAPPGSSLVKPAGNLMPGDLAPIVFGMNSGNCVPANGVYSGTNATSTSKLNFPPGDWDTGMALTCDGAYINKADEGTIVGIGTAKIPYYDNLSLFQNSGSTFFSPNRQMPSAVMFGSLPTGVHANRPWQTLLFRPDPGGTPQHIGAQSPQDHLWLDLFNMPVVEPYPISDPFSTAGKINMNYQIIPFTYLVRDTAVRAVLKSEQMLVLSNTDSKAYKQDGNFPNRRYALDLNETLTGFTNRFNGADNIKGNSINDIFRSASEICNIWLVPQYSPAQTYATMPTFWSSKLLTGDNVRERPYANIYPRLTTKSNTYTVHYRVQTLKKTKGPQPSQWNEGKDSITAEYRGSTTFERYLDTGDLNIPDYATASNPEPLDKFYKFRVLVTKQFTP